MWFFYSILTLLAIFDKDFYYISIEIIIIMKALKFLI